MFVQVIHGAVNSEPEAKEMFDRWMDEIRPGAVGWLGSTAGVTPDGELVVVVRFASEQEARRNSERPEQDAWWAEMEKQFTAPPTFHDCDDVAPLLDGGRNDPGFVQIMQWPAAGSHDAAEMASMTADLVREYRPDVIGGLVAVARDGTVFETVYFTSEKEARRAEAEPMPEEVRQQMEELMAELGEPTYFDLPVPIIVN
jgi:hypothetical protein